VCADGDQHRLRVDDRRGRAGADRLQPDELGEGEIRMLRGGAYGSHVLLPIKSQG
jgi:hypothetical protein